MKIGIDATPLARSYKTGVDYYAQGLLQALAKTAPNDSLELIYAQPFWKRDAQIGVGGPNVWRRRIGYLSARIYSALDHYLIPPPLDLLAGIKTEVFLFPNFFRFPLLFCHKSVVVVHDLAFLETPQYLTTRHRTYLTRRIPQSVRKATKVVTISEHTKKQLVANYKVPADKISVITPAIDHKAYKRSTKSEIEAIKDRYGITGDYILFLGTLEPRKNIIGIIEGYKALPDELRTQYQLVLAGGKGWLDDDITAAISSLPKGRVIRTGYVGDADKPALYSGATTFIYPSHYEGWGMQVLEAMACGTPVITAKNTSLPEAGGDAVEYTKTDAPSIAKAIERVLNDSGKRDEMRQAGLEHAKTFTWEASAEKLHDLLAKL